MELHEQLKTVTDQESFLGFVHALVEDRRRSVAAEKKTTSSPYGPDAGGWENITIEDFLEAASAWASSTRFGETQGASSGNPWRRFATFLYSGKSYE